MFGDPDYLIRVAVADADAYEQLPDQHVRRPARPGAHDLAVHDEDDQARRAPATLNAMLEDPISASRTTSASSSVPRHDVSGGDLRPGRVQAPATSGSRRPRATLPRAGSLAVAARSDLPPASAAATRHPAIDAVGHVRATRPTGCARPAASLQADPHAFGATYESDAARPELVGARGALSEAGRSSARSWSSTTTTAGSGMALVRPTTSARRRGPERDVGRARGARGRGAARALCDACARVGAGARLRARSTPRSSSATTPRRADLRVRRLRFDAHATTWTEARPHADEELDCAHGRRAGSAASARRARAGRRSPARAR